MQDTNGVYYQDFSREVLVLTPPSLKVLEVPSSVHTIRGGAESESAFFPCRRTITNITFASGSRLKSIETYGLGNLELVETIDLRPCTLLTSIPLASFRCTKMKYLYLPETCTNVESGAFASCSNLLLVEFPDTLQTLGSYHGTYRGPFDRCDQLEIVFRETSKLTTIGSTCFFESKISSIFIPKLCTSIGSKAFGGTFLSKITIDKENPIYTTDGKAILKGDTIIFFPPKLNGSYSLPENITKISEGCFANTMINEVILHNNVKELQFQCFAESQIKSLEIPGSVTSFGPSIFANNIILESARLPPVETIHYDTFKGCCRLNSIVIPDNVQILQTEVFYNCTSLLTLTIPSSVHIICGGCFSLCNLNFQLHFASNNHFLFEDGIIYSKNKDKIIQHINSNKDLSLELPDTVETILMKSFFYTNLTSLTIRPTSNLITIEESAFSGSKIQSIYLPAKLSSIAKSSFSFCNSLQKVEFAEQTNLDSISDGCFFNCQVLSQITLPQSITSIEPTAFCNCKMISSLLIPSIVKNIGESAFESSGIQTAILPADLTTLGNKAFYKSNLKVLEFPSNSLIQTIPQNAFSFTLIDHLKITSGIFTLEQFAFQGCSRLLSVDFGPSLNTIAISAFLDCELLNNVTIGLDTNLTSIVGTAFSGCTSLRNLEVPEGHQRYSSVDGVLYGLAENRVVLCLPTRENPVYVLPAHITTIDANAFTECALLAEFRLEEGRESNLVMIGFQAFQNCAGLRSIHIPKGIQIIGAGAFVGCSSLGCGSVVAPQAIVEKMISEGVPAGAFIPCPTQSFTTMHQSEQHAALMIACVIGGGE